MFKSKHKCTKVASKPDLFIAIFDQHSLVIIEKMRMRKTMFFRSPAIFLVVWVTALVPGPPVLLGQDPPDLYRTSLASFEAGHYDAALEGFRSLEEAQQGNPMVSYYTGRCLVELNRDLDEAIELLYGAAGKGVPGDVILYLGMAYHRNYNFPEALKQFSRYEMDASRQDVKEHRVKELINTCRSAMEITANYNQYDVMTVTFLDLSDSAEYSQIKMAGGTLRRKPPEYFQEDETREGLASLMFVPENPLRGDYVYFVGPGRSGKDGTQLFRVRKGPGRSWGEPEELKTLNTPGDELLPYFDPIEGDLYFASDGGPGIGGFDLYMSHFDRERDEWSGPVNMGFPVNSAMDEYLLLPGSDLGMMMFFSNREGTDSTVTVYRVHLVEPKKKTVANDDRMLREIASLGGVAAGILAELETVPRRVEPGSSGSAGTPSTGKPEGRARPGITEVKILSPDEESYDEDAAYRLILARALQHQATSDSLKDLAAEARVRVRESEDPNDRWVWQKQIMIWEKKAGEEEDRADELYAQFEKDRDPAGYRPSVQPPEKVTQTFIVEGEPGTQPPPSGNQDAPMNRFDILRESPYSPENPIPMDVTLPGGVLYRIQMGAYAQAVEPGTFQGISPLTAETVPDRGLIRYYAGKFSRYTDASLALVRVRSAGYGDAFIVSWYNGEPVSTQKAKQLE
jgi:hypothetical protein